MIHLSDANNVQTTIILYATYYTISVIELFALVENSFILVINQQRKWSQKFEQIYPIQDVNNLILYIKRVCVRLLREPFQVMGTIVFFVDLGSRCTVHWRRQMARCFGSTCHCARQFSSINSSNFKQIQLYEKIKTDPSTKITLKP